MVRESIPRKLVSFRIKEPYFRTFKKACELSELRMSTVIESLMFSWLKTYGDSLHEEEEIEKLIGEVYENSNKIKDGEVIEG